MRYFAARSSDPSPERSKTPIFAVYNSARILFDGGALRWKGGRMHDAEFRTGGPIDQYLADLYDRTRAVKGGTIATYIPELAKVDPDAFGIAVATVDGKVYTA